VTADSIHGHYDESQRLFDQLQRLGIGYGDPSQRNSKDNGVTRISTTPGSSSASSWPPPWEHNQAHVQADDELGAAGR